MKRHSIKSIVAATTLGALVAASPVAAQDAMSLSDLLRRVESGRVGDNKENQNREAAFKASKADQDRLLQEAKSEKAALEQRS
ncbi:MAG: hypothetical protein ACR2P6_04435, partial [Gammaproteobacteria bacterium]